MGTSDADRHAAHVEAFIDAARSAGICAICMGPGAPHYKCNRKLADHFKQHRLAAPRRRFAGLLRMLGYTDPMDVVKEPAMMLAVCLGLT